MNERIWLGRHHRGHDLLRRSRLDQRVGHTLSRRPNYHGEDRLRFEAFNRLLVRYGWLGNLLVLFGLTGVAFLEFRHALMGLPRGLAMVGLAVALLS